MGVYIENGHVYTDKQVSKTRTHLRSILILPCTSTVVCSCASMATMCDMAKLLDSPSGKLPERSTTGQQPRVPFAPSDPK